MMCVQASCSKPISGRKVKSVNPGEQLKQNFKITKDKKKIIPFGWQGCAVESGAVSWGLEVEGIGVKMTGIEQHPLVLLPLGKVFVSALSVWSLQPEE